MQTIDATTLSFGLAWLAIAGYASAYLAFRADDDRDDFAAPTVDDYYEPWDSETNGLETLATPSVNLVDIMEITPDATLDRRLKVDANAEIPPTVRADGVPDIHMIWGNKPFARRKSYTAARFPQQPLSATARLVTTQKGFLTASVA